MTIDLDSVNDLVTEQDVEGFIADGAPADEYEGEVEEVFAALLHCLRTEATQERILAILEQTWKKNFSLSDDSPATAPAGAREDRRKDPALLRIGHETHPKTIMPVPVAHALHAPAGTGIIAAAGVPYD